MISSCIVTARLLNAFLWRTDSHTSLAYFRHITCTINYAITPHHHITCTSPALHYVTPPQDGSQVLSEDQGAKKFEAALKEHKNSDIMDALTSDAFEDLLSRQAEPEEGRDSGRTAGQGAVEDDDDDDGWMSRMRRKRAASQPLPHRPASHASGNASSSRSPYVAGGGGFVAHSSAASPVPRKSTSPTAAPATSATPLAPRATKAVASVATAKAIGPDSPAEGDVTQLDGRAERLRRGIEDTLRAIEVKMGEALDMSDLGDATDVLGTQKPFKEGCKKLVKSLKVISTDIGLLTKRIELSKRAAMYGDVHTAVKTYVEVINTLTSLLQLASASTLDNVAYVENFELLRKVLGEKMPDTLEAKFPIQFEALALRASVNKATSMQKCSEAVQALCDCSEEVAWELCFSPWHLTTHLTSHLTIPIVFHHCTSQCTSHRTSPYHSSNASHHCFTALLHHCHNYQPQAQRIRRSFGHECFDVIGRSVVEHNSQWLLSCIKVVANEEKAIKSFMQSDWRVALRVWLKELRSGMRYFREQVDVVLPLVACCDQTCDVNDVIKSLSVVCPGFEGDEAAPVDLTNETRQLIRMFEGSQGMFIISCARTMVASRASELLVRGAFAELDALVPAELLRQPLLPHHAAALESFNAKAQHAKTLVQKMPVFAQELARRTCRAKAALERNVIGGLRSLIAEAMRLPVASDSEAVLISKQLGGSAAQLDFGCFKPLLGTKFHHELQEAQHRLHELGDFATWFREYKLAENSPLDGTSQAAWLALPAGLLAVGLTEAELLNFNEGAHTPFQTWCSARNASGARGLCASALALATADREDPVLRDLDMAASHLKGELSSADAAKASPEVQKAVGAFAGMALCAVQMRFAQQKQGTSMPGFATKASKQAEVERMSEMRAHLEDVGSAFEKPTNAFVLLGMDEAGLAAVKGLHTWCLQPLQVVDSARIEGALARLEQVTMSGSRLLERLPDPVAARSQFMKTMNDKVCGAKSLKRVSCDIEEATNGVNAILEQTSADEDNVKSAQQLISEGKKYQVLLQSCVGMYGIIAIVQNKASKCSTPEGENFRKMLAQIHLEFLDPSKGLTIVPSVLQESKEVLVAHGYPAEKLEPPPADPGEADNEEVLGVALEPAVPAPSGAAGSKEERAADEAAPAIAASVEAESGQVAESEAESDFQLEKELEGLLPDNDLGAEGVADVSAGGPRQFISPFHFPTSPRHFTFPRQFALLSLSPLHHVTLYIDPMSPFHDSFCHSTGGGQCLQGGDEPGKPKGKGRGRGKGCVSGTGAGRAGGRASGKRRRQGQAERPAAAQPAAKAAKAVKAAKAAKAEDDPAAAEPAVKPPKASAPAKALAALASAELRARKAAAAKAAANAAVAPVAKPPPPSPIRKFFQKAPKAAPPS